MARNNSKKHLLEEFLRVRQPAAIDETVWGELTAMLAPVSESYLRQLLHATGLPIAQPLGGVRQHSLEDLETSLREIGAVYATGDAETARKCRRAVIQAKDHARLVAKNEKVDAEKRKTKSVMVEWMLVWLENPGIFDSWVALRKKTI